MVTPLVKHKIVKKRLKPFLRNQSDGKLAMGVRALPPLCSGSRGAAVAAAAVLPVQAAPPLPGTSARAASAFLATCRASARRARVWGPLWAREIRAA